MSTRIGPRTEVMRNSRRMRFNKKEFTLLLSLIFILLSSTRELQANDVGRASIAIYGGPSSPTPLLDLVQLKVPTLAPYYSLNSALNYPYFRYSELFALEVEASCSLYSESIKNTSFQGAGLLRWLATPWNKVIKSSLAIGVGLSYALSPPEIELQVLPRTSRLLMHVILEYAADLDKSSSWQGLFRIHHRSGAYGLFDGVVGGSDYLCLGIRYKI